jgi:plastocyanin
VVVQGYEFPPISAPAGSTLTLVNRDDEPHSVTADDGTFDVGPFTSTKSATLTVPTTPGSYAFHCRIHPTMHGTLVVQ